MGIVFLEGTKKFTQKKNFNKTLEGTSCCAVAPRYSYTYKPRMNHIVYGVIMSLLLYRFGTSDRSDA